MKTSHAFFLIGSIFLGTLSAQLQPLIVDWGHDWGSAWYRQQPNQNANPAWRPLATEDLNGNGKTDDDFIGGWPLDFDVPLSPQNIVYDYTYPSARFYGAAIVTVTDLPQEPDGSYKRPSAPTEGHINQNHELRDDWNLMCFPTVRRQPEASRYAGAMLVYWEKKDFLNGGNGFRVSMDADSSIGVFISRYWGGMNWGRWIIRDSGTFYISEATFAGQTQQFDLTDANEGNGARNPVVRITHTVSPAATRWAVYNPRPPHEVFFDADAAEFVSRSFDNVDAVGFLAQRDMSTGHPVAGGLWDLPHGIGEPIALKFNAVQVRARVQRPDFTSEIVRLRPVDNAFHLSEPVTYAQWLRVRRWAVTNQRARNFTDGYQHHEFAGYSFHRDGAMGDMLSGRSAEHHPGEPVTSLSWHDAALWCNALSELEGLTPAYYLDAAFTQPFRRVYDRSKLETRGERPVIHWKADATGYRLPRADELVAAEADGPVAHFLWPVDGNVMDPAALEVLPVLGGNPSAFALPFAYDPFDGSPGIGFRVLRNGAGALQSTPRPANLTRIPRGERIRPATTPDTNALRQAVLAAGAWVRVPGGGLLPETDTHERTPPVGDPYPVQFSAAPVSYRVWNLVRQWAQSEKGYRFNYEGDMGSTQYLTDDTAAFVRTPSEPVTHIAWVDAVVWCNALSELFGLEPVYVDKTTGEVWRDAGGHRVDSYEPYAYANTGRYNNRPLDTAAVIQIRALTGRSGFRLPTLAEMEAVSDKSSSADDGWFRENSGGRTHPVGTKNANAHGLFDVEGNVQEHTWGGNSLFGQVRFGKSFADHSGTFPHTMTRMESPHVGRSYVGFRPLRRAE